MILYNIRWITLAYKYNILKTKQTFKKNIVEIVVEKYTQYIIV